MYTCMINIILINLTISFENYRPTKQANLSTSYIKSQPYTPLYLSNNIIHMLKNRYIPYQKPPFSKKLKYWTHIMSSNNYLTPDILFILMRDIKTIIIKTITSSLFNDIKTCEIDSIKWVFETTEESEETNKYVHKLNNTLTFEELEIVILSMPKNDLILKINILKKFIISYFGFKKKKEHSFFLMSSSCYLKKELYFMSEYTSDTFKSDQEDLLNAVLDSFYNTLIQKDMLRDIIYFLRDIAKYQRYHNMNARSISIAMAPNFFYRWEVQFIHTRGAENFKKLLECLIYPGEEYTKNVNEISGVWKWLF